MHRGAQIRRCELCEGFIQALTKPGDSRRRSVQVEDRRADLLDDTLQVIDAVTQSPLDLAGAGAGDGALQGESDSEEALNDMIV